MSERHIRHVTVPGALEVPLALDALAESEDFDALVALGCIIRGETYHFELVANERRRRHARLARPPPADRQRHPHRRERGPGLGARRGEGPRRRARRRRDGQPAGRPVVSETSANTPAKKKRQRSPWRRPSARRRAREVALQGLYEWLDRRRRCRRDRRPHARAGRLRPVRRGPLRRAAARLHRRGGRPRRRAHEACRPQDHRALAHRARRADDRRLRAQALRRRALPRWRSTRRWNWPRTSAAPTATSTSTACSTRPRRPAPAGGAGGARRAALSGMLAHRLAARPHRALHVMECAKAAARLARSPECAERPMIFLNIGEPDFTAAPLVREAAERSCATAARSTPTPPGLAPLRERISQWYASASACRSTRRASWSPRAPRRRCSSPVRRWSSAATRC